MTVIDRPWLLRDEPRSSAEETRAGAEYHRAFAGSRRGVWRGILTIVLLISGFVGFGILFTELSVVIDRDFLGRTEEFTPLRHIAGSLSLAALIPYCILLQRLIYGVPAGSLSSVAGRFRFGVLGKTLLLFGPPVLIANAAVALQDSATTDWTTVDLVALFLSGLLVTPLAAAGEEYGFRGLMFRVVGSWARNTHVGLICGIVTTTVVFSLMHGTLDPYLLTSYLVLFGTMAVLTWRTGGLEMAVVLHSVYNLNILLATTLHIDLGAELNNRSQAVGSPANLIPGGVLLLITAGVWWMTRASGPPRTAP